MYRSLLINRYGIELLCGYKQMRFLPRKTKVVNKENRKKTVMLLKSKRKLRSSSSELISVHCAPNLHIGNAKMSNVRKCRAYISTFKTGDFDRKVSFANHCNFASIRIELVCVKYQQNNLHLETKSTRTYGNFNKQIDITCKLTRVSCCINNTDTQLDILAKLSRKSQASVHVLTVFHPLARRVSRLARRDSRLAR